MQYLQCLEPSARADMHKQLQCWYAYELQLLSIVVLLKSMQLALILSISGAGSEAILLTHRLDI